jgi:hypothetical protein
VVWSNNRFSKQELKINFSGLKENLKRNIYKAGNEDTSAIGNQPYDEELPVIQDIEGDAFLMGMGKGADNKLGIHDTHGNEQGNNRG